MANENAKEAERAIEMDNMPLAYLKGGFGFATVLSG